MSIGRKILSFFYPERCPYCNKLIEAEDIACKECMQKLIEKQRPITRGAMGCRCVSSFVYDGHVRRMLLRIKYHERIQHIRQVAHIMAKDIRWCYGDNNFDLITAVPMHPKDKRERGYNQCDMLAKELSKLLDIPYAVTLEKVKKTRKQHHLTYSERKNNLRGAFKAIDKDSIKGKRILLIDDIVTSGYTLGNCAKALTKAKCSVICCATVADAEVRIDKSSVI